MAQRTFLDISFPQSGRREIVAGFCGGQITSDAGLLLIRSVEKRLKLSKKLAAGIADARDPLRITHTIEDMIRQRIAGIACGYEDCNDHMTLRNDPLFQLTATESEKQLASPPTLSRLENSITRKELAQMQSVFLEVFFNAHKSPPAEIILDFDASDITIHGNQEGRFFNGYYDNYCYLPLYVYCGNFLLAALLRPSNVDGAKHSAAILRLLVSAIRKRWPSTKIVFRGDGGFCREPIMRWCEFAKVNYIIGLPKNSRLEKLSIPAQNYARRRFERESRDGTKVPKGRAFNEFKYQTIKQCYKGSKRLKSWQCARRVIARVEVTEKGNNPRYIVTNMIGSPKRLYEDVYCQRGEMENRIKEHQYQMFGDRTSCPIMKSNQFRLTLSAAAYVLTKELQRQALQGTELERAEVLTIRTRLLKIGAVITISTRRICFALASGYPLQQLFRFAAARLNGPIYHPNT